MRSKKDKKAQPDIKEQISDLALQGVSFKEIARLVGMPEIKVRNTISRLGLYEFVKTANKSPFNFQREYINAYYGKKPLKEIAENLGLLHITVINYMKRQASNIIPLSDDKLLKYEKRLSNWSDSEIEALCDNIRMPLPALSKLLKKPIPIIEEMKAILQKEKEL